MPTAFNSRPWPARTAPLAELCDEASRGTILAAYGYATLEDDPELADVVRFAARVCETPIALVSLVDSEWQRFLAAEGLEQGQTPRDQSFCAHAMLQGEVMIIPDAQEDPRFATNPLVTGPPHIRFYAGAPLISPEGAPLGALCVIAPEPRAAGLTDVQIEGLEVLARAVMRRLSDQRIAEHAVAAIRESESRFRRLAETMPQLAWSADANGVFDYVNGRLAEFGGAGISEAHKWLSLFHPDDLDDMRNAYINSIKTGAPLDREFRMRDKEGIYRWFLARANPARSKDGKITRWFGTITDIDETRRLLEERDILSRELSHRIKNIFAVISSLISLKVRKHPEANGFANDISATIRALARAHTLVREEEAIGANRLHALIREVIQPFFERMDSEIRIAGDDMPVTPHSTTPLALTMHELATNAFKYGALSAPGGSVDVTTKLEGDTASLIWVENGGPPLPELRENGFGTRLIDLSVINQLGAALERDWRPTGLVITLKIPVSAL